MAAHAPVPTAGLRRPLIGLGLVFLLLLPAVTTRIYASDEIEYFAYLRSLWFDRDLSFDNEYRHFYDAGIARSAIYRETFLERTTPTGLRLNFAPMGSALLWTPFFAAGDLVARSMAAAGHDVTTDGYSWPYIAAICYGSAIYGFLAIILSTMIAARFTRPASVAALAVWIGTPLLFYMYVAPPMSHAPSAFMVAAFLFTWLSVRQAWSTRGFLLLGALAAVMTMVREQDVFFVIGPALDLVWTATRHRFNGRFSVPALAGRIAAGSVTFAVVFIPQALTYLALNGRLGPPNEVGRKMSWTTPHFLEVVLSPRHGFFFWTPLAVLAIAGLILMAVRGRRSGGSPDEGDDRFQLAICALAMIVGQIYIAGSVESWTVAGAFGQRRFVALTPLLVVGIAGLFAAITGRLQRRLALAAVALCLWWNVGLMAQFGMNSMDRQRLELSRNAYNTFVVIPRALPDLARRYLFDRSSFYKNRAQSRTSGRP